MAGAPATPREVGGRGAGPCRRGGATARCRGSGGSGGGRGGSGGDSTGGGGCGGGVIGSVCHDDGIVRRRRRGIPGGIMLAVDHTTDAGPRSAPRTCTGCREV